MKAVVFLSDGFEECEGLLVVDIFRRAGIETVMASIMGRIEVESSRNICVKADAIAEDVDYKSANVVVLPGGRQGMENLRTSSIVHKTVKEFSKNKMVAAVCAAPTILAELGLLNGKTATVHPDYAEKMSGVKVLDKSVVIDGNIITGQGLGATIPFALELVKMLVGVEEADRIRKEICYKDF